MASNNLNLGIDASNIRTGGGLTHLVELLNAATPQEYGINKVIVCPPNRYWLKLVVNRG